MDYARRNVVILGEQIGKVIKERRFNKDVPFTGESGALIRDILPSARALRHAQA